MLDRFGESMRIRKSRTGLRSRKAKHRRAVYGARYVAELLETRLLLSGVTLITHGLGDNAQPGSWVANMANTIAGAAGHQRG